MHKGDLIITNKTRRRVIKSMQVLLEELMTGGPTVPLAFCGPPV